MSVIDSHKAGHDVARRPVPALRPHARAVPRRTRRLFGWGMVAAALLLGPPPLAAADRSVILIEPGEEPIDNPPPAAGPPANDAGPLVSLRTDNPSGLRLDILPNASLRLGTRIAFKVSTQRPGYLVLVDVNAEGRLTQIYPNVMSLSRSSRNVAEANLIKPDAPVTIPNPKNPLARFIFTADPPAGSGAIVAILSDKPVQIIDLPETGSVQGAQALVDTLCQSVVNLKIASSDASGKFTAGTWSFAATPYVIQ